jgi:serine/threonine protein kinase
LSVALKVLPEAFTPDPDRFARFKREAQVLASLNDPNIAAICGFEESSPSADSEQGAVQALVLELVEGPTPAARIAQRSIPLIEARRLRSRSPRPSRRPRAGHHPSGSQAGQYQVAC